MNPGARIQDRYVLEELVGSGSFGRVFRAHDTASDRLVALKMSSTGDIDEPTRHRFRREAKVAMALVGPHTVPLLDHGEHQGALFMVMELLAGETLADRLTRLGALGADTTMALAVQLLAGVSELHALGIVHRDLKPENVFLCAPTSSCADELLKVFDLGIAKLVGTGDLRETTRLTQVGGTLGTPRYMSPEQCRGLALTPASDAYAIGAVLYECLTGTPPFDHHNPAEIMTMHATQDAPALPERLLETRLGGAVACALAKEPSDRFGDAHDFLTYLTGAGTLPRRRPEADVHMPTRPERDASPASSERQVTEIITAPGMSARAWVAIGCVAAVVAAVFWLALR